MKCTTNIVLFTYLLLNLKAIEVASYKLDAKALGSRIVGGHEAFAGQFHFSAAIYVKTETGQYFCGGSLIEREWILTAGHCVVGATLFTINLGSHTLEDDDLNRITVATSDYILHEEFDAEGVNHDIGLIKLRIPVTLTGYIGLITLPVEEFYPWSSLLSIGHGQTSDDHSGLSNNLLYAVVTSITNDECKVIYGNQITETMVCAIGNFNQGTCLGDIGGPLILASGKLNQVVGIASFISADGCESINPSGYTRTYYYLDWLRNITGA